jgi:multidrug efflux system membrane fusion protein
MRVLFQEGQVVKAGDLLAEIDPRPFDVLLTQAQGQLVRDQALLTNARVDLKRYESAQPGAIPEQQIATQRSLVRQYEGAVETDQGQVDNAHLQLTYCRITAPLSGRVGLRLVDPGNIVHAADANGLVVITQLEPIGALFTIPEDSIPSVLDKLGRNLRLKAEAYDREQRAKLAEGTLLTVDNQIDPATGTVRLKATFPNTDHRLFPNQFVNVRLVLDVRRGVTAVPAAAVQRSPGGAFVYVVRPDSAVEARKVTVGPAEGDDVAIDAGLRLGEQVVVDGAERLRDGSRVEAQARRAA